MNFYDNIIVGSGAGGASLAKSLSERGAHNLVLEQGCVQRIGRIRDCLRFYDLNRFFKTVRHSKEGVPIWQSYMAGGSTMVSCGNIARCLEKELKAVGVDLSKYFEICEEEIKPSFLCDDLLGPRSIMIKEAALKLGYNMNPALKGINSNKCVKCGKCVFGCRYGAKWDALKPINEAKRKGCVVKYDSPVEKITHEHGRVTGVVLKNGTVYRSRNVILCAGGVNSPIILQKSGIKNAGKHFFCDLLVNVYGAVKNTFTEYEPVMALINSDFYQDKGFIVASYMSQHPLYQFLDRGVKGLFQNPNKMLGMMVKIRDDRTGSINSKGVISKYPSPNDREKLNAGIKVCEEILAEAGAGLNFTHSSIQGAHPGGSCAIGEVVDTNLETEIKGLFVSDASVLPVSPGFPPILTISALSRYLADKIFML